MADPTHIKDLIEDPNNRRAHTPRNHGMIVDSLQAVGPARSIVIDEANMLLAGHGVRDAALEAGITKLKIIDVDGDTVVAVRRRNLTPEQKRKLAMYDNRTNELSDWSAEQLRQDVADGLDLSFVFTDDELKDALGDDADKVRQVKIDKPAEIVWCLLAIPIKDWAKHQATVDKMQVEAQWSSLYAGSLKDAEESDG